MKQQVKAIEILLPQYMRHAYITQTGQHLLTCYGYWFIIQ